MNPETERRTLAEQTLDVLLAHELRTSSPAAELLWHAVGWTMPSEPKVLFQVKRASDGRTTDVEARASGRRLLCENKLADGLFQPGQVDGYRSEVLRRPSYTRAVFVAPAKFLKAKSAKLEALLEVRDKRRGPLVGTVSVEALAGSLRIAAAKLAFSRNPSAKGLARCYRDRAKLFSDLCKSKTPELSEPHVAFRSGYDERAQAIANGRVRLLDGTLSQGGGFAWFAEDLPSPRGFDLAHKLYQGCLDVRVPGWTLRELSSHIEQMPPTKRPPERWRVCATRNARRNSATGEPTPVLRCKVPPVRRRIEACNSVDARALGREAADGAVRAADGIGRWLQNGGVQLLGRPTIETLRAELTAAINAATRLRLSDVASPLGRVSAAVAGRSRHRASSQ